MSEVARLQRFLDILDCPFSVETSSRINHLQFQVKLLRWLEDRKIRQLDIKDRHILAFDDLTVTENAWTSKLNEYLSTIGCPVQWIVSSGSIPGENLQALLWLARHAVSLDCEDAKAFSSEETNPEALSQALQPLRSVFQATETASNDTELVRKFAQQVKMMTLSTKKDKCNAELFELLKQSLFAGNETGEKDVVQDIATAYRMLYLSDFRELQNDANKLIVLAQDCTADPKLNFAKGKVGR